MKMTAEQQQLVVDNMKLVPWVLSKICHITQSHPHFDDLIAEGYITLCKSAMKYNSERNCAFATYAVNSIQWDIWKALYEGSYANNKGTKATIRSKSGKKWMEGTHFVSLDYVLSNEQSLAEVIPDGAQSVETAYEAKETWETFTKFLGELPNREREILMQSLENAAFPEEARRSGRNQAKLAKKYHCFQGRISQIYKITRAKIANKLISA
jgi:RNA polymerase sigma factor (sigma-70 family)